MTPERLEVLNKGTLLRIVWPDERPSEIGATILRRECRSAGALRAQIDDRAQYPEDIRITAVEPVGIYAVNIAFSDGEHRGIYPFTFLAELAARETADSSA
ncbi:MAG: gamma-butyrobetaine hydroxylase-like domain-containing protein [Rhodomicrobiaceae bacterium]